MFDSPSFSDQETGFISKSEQTEFEILLVEDDLELNTQLTRLLQAQHYKVCAETCGQKALEQIKTGWFDLIILDVDLPEIDGFCLLQYIREKSTTPVMMLTASGAEEHRIRGLKSGADDYVTKPCSFTEVQLRIEAILRRTAPQYSPYNRATQNLDSQLILDRANHQVQVLNDASSSSEQHAPAIPLTPVQFKLLWTLVQNKGQALSKAYLYQAVLERDYSQYDRSLDMHLSRIRKKLVNHGMDAERIQTLYGKGYLFK